MSQLGMMEEVSSEETIKILQGDIACLKRRIKRLEELVLCQKMTRKWV